MACEDLVSGCFGGALADFAVHQLDAERAAEYLLCCVKAQLTWEQVEEQIRNCLTGKVAESWIDEQIYRAQQMMLPWLEHHRQLSSTVVNIRK